ncbi:hypothetical protein TraAM80_09669 [Trypanosoma rangeli]|uniref:Uncharacterized protein n=1 Tax=Trypanosoma rangeli TaxID=5698 RepID=A0A422MTZ8_TRYRA|nr:uncharacterized protein TraAM80_09669 [Trypanosoma rangeli]RNE96700.1 hypothetical protein TraAM80_09669 [Trypanosoma rangeli]|eukprot:RNE96700.1 hypothetical protein TraAM80_09669 [Trypanosoma rangeli]
MLPSGRLTFSSPPCVQRSTVSSLEDFRVMYVMYSVMRTSRMQMGMEGPGLGVGFGLRRRLLSVSLRWRPTAVVVYAAAGIRTPHRTIALIAAGANKRSVPAAMC